jgi:hypothetical protein
MLSRGVLYSGIYRFLDNNMALVHCSGMLDAPHSIKEACVEDAWKYVMEIFVESLIHSKFAVDRSVVAYRDMVIGFSQVEGVDQDVTLTS